MLLKYILEPHVTAFSTTRKSPFDYTPDQLDAMGNYAAFNVTDYCGDKPDRVCRNQRWLCNELGIHPNNLWIPHQTHTDRIAVIDDAILKMCDADRVIQLENVDALITNIPNQCIGVSTADCVPIILWDTEHRAAASIHSGWKGTVQRIAQKTVNKMRACYKTRPEALKAIIGPSISVDAFEVGDEVVQAFTNAGFPSDVISSPIRNVQNGEYRKHIDLWAANCYLLETAGIPLSHIQVAGICTYDESDQFFSARRHGIQSGRIFTGIMFTE